MNLLAYFDVYVSQGLKIIPLKNKSKIPIFKNWNKRLNSNTRDIISQSDCNMGLLLGSIIDVEGDTKEANKTLMRMLKDYPHPIYASSRSTHHLFINPYPQVSIAKYRGIEFRGNNHHSVLPPSLHPNGSFYEWLPESRFPIPKMPFSLLSLFKKAKSKTQCKKPNRVEPFCSICQNQFFVHEKRFRLEVNAFKSLGEIWCCQKCRKIDVREICRGIRNQKFSLKHPVELLPFSLPE